MLGTVLGFLTVAVLLISSTIKEKVLSHAVHWTHGFDHLKCGSVKNQLFVFYSVLIRVHSNLNSQCVQWLPC